MKNIKKGLTVPKWVLLNQPKIPQISQNLSDNIFCPRQEFGILVKKGFIGRP
jgi:hypothetical protein